VESPFAVLGVDPGADEAAVERAYRRRVKESHPDHGGSLEEFRRVRAAYEEIASGRASDGPATDDSGVEERSVRAEYLNYAVLDDHGWRLDDGDLFEKASAADLDPADHGRILVREHESLLEAAENRGFAWPYACRGGACANCAVAVVEGDLSMPVDHILPPDLTERGIRLSCVGAPTTGGTKVVYNVKRMPDLDELRLPADRFERATGDD